MIIPLTALRNGAKHLFVQARSLCIFSSESHQEGGFRYCRSLFQTVSSCFARMNPQMQYPSQPPAGMYPPHAGYTNGVNGVSQPPFPNQQRPGHPPQQQYPNGNSTEPRWKSPGCSDNNSCSELNISLTFLLRKSLL